MNEQERRSTNKEEQKRKIRARYKGINRDELEFIPAKQKEKLFEDTTTKRVAAYCRVSTDDAKQTSSYELQRNHYEDMIKEHIGWELVGIYADEGISGTSLQHRDDFNRMMEDCRAGKIDLIVTKSVSRFARNIVDCIAMLFELDEPEMIKVEEIVLPPKEEESEGETVKKTIYIFPPEWAGTFGQPITSVAQIGILQQEHYAGNWDVLRPASEIKEMNIFTADGLNTLLHEAEEIMEGWIDIDGGKQNVNAAEGAGIGD